MAAKTIPIISRGELETGRIWESEYHMVDSQTHLSRRWKLEQDKRDPLTILHLLPDLQQPQLPEGYLWLKVDFLVLLSQFLIRMMGVISAEDMTPIVRIKNWPK